MRMDWTDIENNGNKFNGKSNPMNSVVFCSGKWDYYRVFTFTKHGWTSDSDVGVRLGYIDMNKMSMNMEKKLLHQTPFSTTPAIFPITHFLI